MYKHNLKSSSALFPQLKNGLILLSLSLLLSSCSSLSTLPPIKETQMVTPPKALTEQTPDPMEGRSLSGLTNGQLFSFLKQYKAALNSCNNDKMLIEDFVSQSAGGP